MKQKFVIFLVFLFPAVVLLLGINRFPYSPGAEYSDFTITHYPNALFIQESIVHFQQVPFWNPHFFSGYPFDADPLSGLHYPPGWIALIFPQPFGMNLMVLLHTLSGAFGMYCLLRVLKAEVGISILGAIIFESSPKIFGHLANGHLTMVMAVSWTPWLLYFETKYIDTPTKPINLLLSGIAMSLIITCDMRWAFYTILIWAVFLVWMYQCSGQFKWKQVLSGLLVKGIYAGLLSASLLLPFTRFLPLSTRSMMDVNDVLSYSLPIPRIINFIYPDIAGFGEWQIYPGIVPVFFALGILFDPSARKKGWIWLSFFMAALIWAVGEQIDLLTYIGSLPLIGLLRVPPRILNSAGLIFGILAVYYPGVKTVFIEGKSPGWMRYSNLVVFSLALFGILFGIGFAAATGKLLNGFLWSGIGLALLQTILVLRQRKILTSTHWMAAVIGIAMLDTGSINFFSIQYRPESEILNQKPAVTEYIKLVDPTRSLRIYSPSYSIEQQDGIKFDFYSVNGVNPMQLAKYAHFFESASGIPINAYTVTLPPFKEGDPKKDNTHFLPIPHQLGLLNVGIVVSEFDIIQDDLELGFQSGRTRVYTNKKVLPRAWIEANHNSTQIPVEITFYSPNEIRLHTEKAGLLVLSEINYPGWRLTIDGKKGVIEEFQGIFRSTTLSEGVHEVVFEYVPNLFLIGCSISLLSLALMIFIVIRK